MVSLETISHKDIFSRTPEERARLIAEAVELVLIQTEWQSYKQNLNFSMTANLQLQNINKNITLAKENEDYELCYFLEELTWGLLQKINEINELKRNAETNNNW